MSHYGSPTTGGQFRRLQRGLTIVVEHFLREVAAHPYSMAAFFVVAAAVAIVIDQLVE